MINAKHHARDERALALAREVAWLPTTCRFSLADRQSGRTDSIGQRSKGVYIISWQRSRLHRLARQRLSAKPVLQISAEFVASRPPQLVCSSQRTQDQRQISWT